MFKERPNVKPSAKSLKKAPELLVVVSLLAHAKAQEIVNQCEKEVGWVEEVTREETDDGYIYIVHDAHLLKQEVTGATVDVADNALLDVINKADNPLEMNRRIRGWAHSHVNMGVTPSGTDDEMTMDFVTQSQCEWFVVSRANKKGERQFDIIDDKLKTWYTDVPWIIDYKLPDVEKEITADIKELVSEKSYTYSYKYGNKKKAKNKKKDKGTTIINQGGNRLDEYYDDYYDDFGYDSYEEYKRLAPPYEDIMDKPDVELQTTSCTMPIGLDQDLDSSEVREYVAPPAKVIDCGGKQKIHFIGTGEYKNKVTMDSELVEAYRLSKESVRSEFLQEHITEAMLCIKEDVPGVFYLLTLDDKGWVDIYALIVDHGKLCSRYLQTIGAIPRWDNSLFDDYLMLYSLATGLGIASNRTDNVTVKSAVPYSLYRSHIDALSR